MIIDTHCHYNLEPLYSDEQKDLDVWKKHWRKAQENGVEKSIVVGTHLQTSVLALEMATQEKNLFATIGTHPYIYAEPEIIQKIETQQLDDCLADLHTDIEKLSQLKSDKLVAIGEVGLDYFHLNQQKSLSDETKTKVKELQKVAFKKHIELAQEKNLPLILHVRDQGEEAYLDVLRCLKETDYSGKLILHCVSGPEEYVKQAIEMGAYVGVAGNVTYKSADHIRALVKLAPIDRVLLETDAPYLPPQEFRGQVCEPWMISLTAQFIEKELGILLPQVQENTYRLFPSL
jgi:TatD DNase family protein